MKYKIGWLLLLPALVGGLSFAYFRPDITARTAAGLTAHSLCSAAFVSGVDADTAFRELVAPLVGRSVAALLDYRVNRNDQSVSASTARLWQVTAQHVHGFGCRLEFAGDRPLVTSAAQATPATDAREPTSSAPSIVKASDPAVDQAIDQVFEEIPGEPLKRVKAVVVVRAGRLVGERYAPGVGIDTPLLSFSVAKSVTNALLGILVLQGQIRVGDPIEAPEWHDAGDPRAQITFEDLMRMQSALDAPETGSGFDAATRMLYSESDMAAFAAHARLNGKPRESWEYTSANTLLLNRAIAARIGSDAASIRSFAERALFSPLSMRNVTMEFDGAGTFIGSSYVYASARDFARFGLLYANDGLAPDGRRILPEGWVTWSRRSTLGSSYGAGFWTNDGPSTHAAGRVAEGFAKDGFYASGNMGQRIYIVPSSRLVIARFGYSDPPLFGLNDDLALIRAASAAAADDNLQN